MLLEKIKNFNWINEPQNVEFIEKGLLITTKPQTDFWQNTSFNISKNDGHFFACLKEGDFSLSAKWFFEKNIASAQCGLLVSSDPKNWIKVGVLSMTDELPQIGVVTSNNGACDWSSIDLEKNTQTVYFKIKRKGDNFIVFYSPDGNEYKQIRLISHPLMRQIIDAGAYSCSPKKTSFECILEEIDIE